MINKESLMKNDFLTGLSIGIVVGSFIGSIICSYTISTTYRSEAIERNYAEYDTVTGNWQWIDSNEHTIVDN